MTDADLRLLYARVGITYCRVCGREVYKDSPESVADEILRTLPEGTRFYVLFPAHAGLAETERNGHTGTRRGGDTENARSKSPRTRVGAFRALIDAGGSLLVIEHNLDVIKTADYIIDLGPEGGDAGGHVVVTGTPEKIMSAKNSHTGKYLREHLAKSNGHAA